MLEQADALLSIAEIAATFAGFAALVTLFGRRRVAGTAAHDLLRLRLVIATSVVVVLISLVPVALAGYGLTVGIAWRVAAGVGLLLRYLAIGSFIASYRRVQDHFEPDRLAVGVYSVIEVLVQVALLAVLFGFADGNENSLYVSSLVGTLAQAAFVFLRLVESAFGTIVVGARRPPGEDGGDG